MEEGIPQVQGDSPVAEEDGPADSVRRIHPEGHVLQVFVEGGEIQNGAISSCSFWNGE